MSTAVFALGGLTLLLSRGSSGRVARRRADRLAPDPDRAGVARAPVPLAAVAGIAAAALCLACFGAAGVVYACVAAPAAHFVAARLAARAGSSSARHEVRALPLLLDLLAAAIRAGAPVPLALTCIAETATGKLKVDLTRTAALLRLGAGPGEAWAPLADDAVLAPLAAVASRSATSGIRLAEALVRQADALRAYQQSIDVNRAQRVGVVALLPLGLCFLPAFVCLGIAPIVVGVAGTAFAAAR